MESVALMNFLKVIPDPRINRTLKHKLIDIIVITVCAVLSGCEGWVEIVDFAERREGWFQKFLELPNGIPSHDTFGRVFSILDPEVFQKSFFEWLCSVHSVFVPQTINIDGKVLRGALKESRRPRSAIQLVNAWSSELGLFLGMKKSELKKEEGEKRIMEQLIESLYLKGCIVTLDANGATGRITTSIINKEADYVIGLKDNQSALLKYAEFAFGAAKPDGEYGTTEKDHGRLETRKYELIDISENPFPTRDASWKIATEKFPKLHSLIKVSATRSIGDQQTTEQRYFISSLTEVRKGAEAIRSHWGVENKLHRTLDVTFNEDHCQIRTGHAAENLGLVRRMAINMLKAETSVKKSIRRKQMACIMDHAYLEKVLGVQAQTVNSI